MGISDGNNGAKVEIIAKEEKTLKETDSFSKLRINKSRVSHTHKTINSFLFKNLNGVKNFLYLLGWEESGFKHDPWASCKIWTW